MGTSGSYGGPSGGNPLIPSWLDGADDAPTQGQDGPVPTPPTDGMAPNQPRETSVSEPDPNRFRGPRVNFTQFVRSGGENRTKLGRALSGYVSRSTGGAGGAALRMGSSKTTSAKLASFLSVASGHGAHEALKRFNLSYLVGRNLSEVLTGLMDEVCPAGGSVDEGIARDAFVETIDSLSKDGDISFDEISQEQLQAIFEIYLCKTIEARICNDIGNKSIEIASDIHVIQKIQEQLFDFIRTSVSMATNSIGAISNTVNRDKFDGYVQEIYEKAFSYLEYLGEYAGDEK